MDVKTSLKEYRCGASDFKGRLWVYLYERKVFTAICSEIEATTRAHLLKDWRARSLTDFRFIRKRLVTHKFICPVYLPAKLFARLDTIGTIWMMKPDKITSVTRKHQYRFTKNRSGRVEKRRNHSRFVTSTFIIGSMVTFLHRIPLEGNESRRDDNATRQRIAFEEMDIMKRNEYRLIALKKFNAVLY